MLYQQTVRLKFVLHCEIVVVFNLITMPWRNQLNYGACIRCLGARTTMRYSVLIALNIAWNLPPTPLEALWKEFWELIGFHRIQLDK